MCQEGVQQIVPREPLLLLLFLVTAKRKLRERLANLSETKKLYCFVWEQGGLAAIRLIPCGGLAQDHAPPNVFV